MSRIILVLLVSLGSAAAQAENRTYTTADGSEVSLRAPRGGATALVFYSSECPISNYYSPTLNAIRAEYPADTLKLIGICVDPDISNETFASHAQEYGLKYPVIRDRHARLAGIFGAEVTPEAVVLDDRGEVRYRGRIDDQYARRLVKKVSPQTHDLNDAIASVLNGKEVPEPEVAAVGCPIPDLPEPEDAKVTYSEQVAPILFANCTECHRTGQIGPFPLETYSQARKRADDLVYVVQERLMPPWKPAPGFGPKFSHDRSLSAEEIATLAAWADAGAPEGDPSKTPPLPKYNDGWTLGKPDLVVEMPEAFDVPASGGDIYRCFVIPTNLPEDRYVAGIQYQPGNPKVVHHIIGYVDNTGAARKKDAEEEGPGYTCFGGPQIEISNELGGWAPGVEASVLPEAIGRPLPKNSDVIIQVHYHPSGKAETDKSRIALYFAKKPTKQAFHWWAAIEKEFELVPDDPSTWKVEAQTLPLPVDVEVLSVAPHMHLLGKDMKMWAELPGGKTIDLVWIDNWDFQWQNQYYFEKPIELPKGSVVKLVSHFDYSSDNPRISRKPDEPLESVKWGEATTDEMCIGFFGIVKKGQDLTQPGQKDDLIKILYRQVDEFKKRETEAKKARGAAQD
ncbi:MAG TPA: redoxin domain-containing protein [Isosphaeraceae bacterium]|nr:redoxin domain-containing protein [Isosphaeraceae bacterium]